jgi:hypothetical protein
MNWEIEEAQQKFSELMSAAVSEPQLIGVSFGTDRPASQFLMVVSVTPSASANCFWVRNCRTLSLIRGDRSDFFIHY